MLEKRTLRWLYGVTTMIIFEKVWKKKEKKKKEAPVTEKLRNNRLAWYGHFMRKDKTRRMFNMGPFKSYASTKRGWGGLCLAYFCWHGNGGRSLQGYYNINLFAYSTNFNRLWYSNTTVPESKKHVKGLPKILIIAYLL